MPVKTKKEDLAKQMLVDRAEYLTSGVHIGMKTCTKYMKKFVYKIRDDGLAVFNIQRVDERIKTAAEFLSSFEDVMAVSRKIATKITLKSKIFADNAPIITYNP